MHQIHKVAVHIIEYICKYKECTKHCKNCTVCKCDWINQRVWFLEIGRLRGIFYQNGAQKYVI